jgi:hypothetical protein
MLRSIITVILGIALLAAAPFLLLWLVRFYFEVIEPYRKRTGHLVNYFGGREPGDGISVTYYEGDKELHFFADDEEKTFYLPNEELWNRTMPDFFKGRQAIIRERLRKRIPRRVRIALVEQYREDHLTLCVDNSKSGPERVLTFGGPADKPSAPAV